MLEFFRKYQSYIYLAVTIVIVISFSFFGTNNVLVSNPVRDQVVFTAVDGEKIRRSELDEMVMFINTDNHDKQVFGGAWGPNFLNPGVIRNDLLKTGLAEALAAPYLQDLQPDLEAKFQREKAYTPYVHPQAKFVSQELVWTSYAPKINTHLKALKDLPFAASPDAFQARVQLFIEEMNFPAYYSKYALRSQEKQFNFIVPDQNLDRQDLSLFGYHTVEDWFGPRFVRLAAQFIINAAKIAEAKGYVVTKEEALADLLRNSQTSYNQNRNNPNLGVLNSAEYYNEQLRILGMDQSQAVKIWTEVLLFKRLFHDVGSAVFTDPLIEQNFSQYANESLEVEAYSLPKGLQFADYRTMQKFEVYLNQIAKRSAEDAKNLTFPKEFLAAADISKRTPELVQKRYLIKLSEANKSNFASKISLKEMWNFEVENWDLLKNKFPELALKKSDTRDDRFAALDSLDEATRSRVDAFARQEIVDSHPEWISDALEKARERTVTVGLSKKGNYSIFQGLENGADLMKELDKAELNGAPIRFTADSQHYYLITVLDRTANDEILTFAQANSSGALDKLLDAKLQAHFQSKKEVKNWTSFDDVKAQVADDYFESLLKAIAASANENETSGNLLTPLRLYGYMQSKLADLKKDPAAFNSEFEEKALAAAENKLPVSLPLDAQWKLEKKPMNVARSEDPKNENLFSLPVNSWTEVIKAPNGDLSFLYVKEKGTSQDKAALFEKMQAVQQLLSNEAQKHYMKQVVNEIQKTNSISFEYLNQPIETMDPQVPVQTDMS